MYLWHLTPDAPRSPNRVSPGDWVTIDIGSWPIEPGQGVWLDVAITHADGAASSLRVDAEWRHNANGNSYWRAELAPFERSDLVEYRVRGRSPAGGVEGPTTTFRVGPRLHLALLWHQHQPLYKDVALPSARGSYLQSTVRRHAIRDYYSMAAMVAEHPRLHLTFNFTPSLLWQIEDYTTHGATDRALELTLIPADQLSPAERDEILRTFFEAHRDNQIRPHPRYAELLAAAESGTLVDATDFADLQMWFNLAWFAKEFRDGDVHLVTGETASVRRFVDQARGFTPDDIQAMVAEQYRILRAVIPIHRQLQERGQIEIATSPYYHPILPLLIDTDAALLDRPGAALPPRFAHPGDAEAQIQLAIADHRRWFGCTPAGLWPPEGAVSEAVIPILVRNGIRWTATDRRVLARSGKWGYPADDPDIFCQPYHAGNADGGLSIFFRDAWLSDHIGFHYQQHPDYVEAAREFLEQMKQRFARAITGSDDRILTVIMDGENAWSAYRDDARPFLHALYRLLEHDPEIGTVTFAEYLDGSESRALAPHAIDQQPRVHDLYPGSWADERGSEPGVDLGTWIGEPEENDAWALLGEVRAHLDASGHTLETCPGAFQAMYAAEGSDWFWWLGTDEESGRDAELDGIFHAHLRGVYHALGEHAPAHITPHAPPRTVLLTPTCPVSLIAPDDRLLVRTQTAGSVAWAIDHAPLQSAVLIPVRGPRSDVRHYQRTIGPFPPGAREARVSLRVESAGLDGPGAAEDTAFVIRLAGRDMHEQRAADAGVPMPAPAATMTATGVARDPS